LGLISIDVRTKTGGERHVAKEKTQLDVFVEHFQQEGERVEHYLPGNGKQVPGYRNQSNVSGALILTNRRLVFISPGKEKPQLHSISLGKIRNVEEAKCGGTAQFIFSGPDFQIKLTDTPEKQPFIKALRKRLRGQVVSQSSRKATVIDLTLSDIELTFDPEEVMSLSRAMRTFSRDGRIVATLVLLFPPLGMYLIWSNPIWAAPWKKGLSTAWCLGLLMLYWLGTTSSPSVAKSNSYTKRGKIHGAARSELTRESDAVSADAIAIDANQSEMQGGDPSLAEAGAVGSIPFYSDIAAAVDAETRFHFEDQTLERGDAASEVRISLLLDDEASLADIKVAVKRTLVRVAFTVMSFTDAQKAHIYVTPFRSALTRDRELRRIVLDEYRGQLVVTRHLALQIVTQMLGVTGFSELFIPTSEGTIPSEACQRALMEDALPGVLLIFDALAKETPLRDWRAERLVELRKLCGPPPEYDEATRSICGARELASGFAPDPNGLMVDDCTRPTLDERCWKFSCQVTGRNNNGIYVSRRQQVHASHLADCELRAM
jgi:hypothetical protein